MLPYWSKGCTCFSRALEWNEMSAWNCWGIIQSESGVWFVRNHLYFRLETWLLYLQSSFFALFLPALLNCAASLLNCATRVVGKLSTAPNPFSLAFDNVFRTHGSYGTTWLKPRTYQRLKAWFLSNGRLLWRWGSGSTGDLLLECPSSGIGRWKKQFEMSVGLRCLSLTKPSLV